MNYIYDNNKALRGIGYIPAGNRLPVDDDAVRAEAQRRAHPGLPAQGGEPRNQPRPQATPAAPARPAQPAVPAPVVTVSPDALRLAIERTAPRIVIPPVPAPPASDAELVTRAIALGQQLAAQREVQQARHRTVRRELIAANAASQAVMGDGARISADHLRTLTTQLARLMVAGRELPFAAAFTEAITPAYRALSGLLGVQGTLAASAINVDFGSIRHAISMVFSELDRMETAPLAAGVRSFANSIR